MVIPVVIAVVIAAVVILGTYFDRQQRAEFRKKFPPLTDDEFVKRCGPGTDPEMALIVRDIIAEQLNIPREEIYPEHRFIDDLHAD